MSRGPTGKAVFSTENVGLSRDQIIERALCLMDEHGVEWLTMRRLAESLNVRAPTLYWHLPNKRALHDACVEVTLDRLRMPAAADGDWREHVRGFMSSMRAQLVSHPSVIRLMNESHPPAMTRMSTEALRIMRSAGLEWQDAFLYCRLMIWRIVGFTGMETTLRTISKLHTPSRSQPRRGRPTRYQLPGGWPEDESPEVQALSTTVDLDLMFSTDVEVFIKGVEAAVR